jgi:PKD repeat protein
MRYVNSSNEAVWSTISGKVSFLGGYKDGALGDAEFASPEDLEFDSKGRLYVCDFDNHAIRLIDGSNVSTVAGNGSLGFKNGTGKNAQFSYPCGIGLESDSFLLVADRNNEAIRRVNTYTGEVTTIISQGLDFPLDVIKVENVIYILEAQCIKMYVNGKLTVYTGKERTSGYVNGDISVARFGRMYHFAYMKAQKSFYIPDHYNNVIRRVPLLLSVNATFAANNTAPIVDQTVTIKSSTEYATSLNWEITPTTYTLQAGSKLTDSIIYVSFNSAGSYSVKLKASNSSSSDEELKNNYINVSTNSTAKPVVDFTATKTKPMVNETITLVDLTANNPTSYSWTITPKTYLLQNSTDLTSRNPQVKFTQTGQYTIKLDASNAFGNHSTTKTSYIQVVLTSVNQEFEKSISMKVFPNPSNGTVNIDGLPEATIVRIYDAAGRNVFNTTNSQFELNPGAYYIVVQNNEYRWSLGKVIVVD